MLIEKLKENNKFCTGCAGCFNVCPVEAIKMTPDKEGFYIPVIEENSCIKCTLCEKVCPQLSCKKNNNLNPKCYAVRASEDIVKVSSSGGAFFALAEYVFQKGGYVCGAAFDSDFKGVSLVMISSPEELYKLHGSKYVYAKPRDIYKDIKRKLEKNRLVLFSGTPCQVAALNNYLDRQYECLITVDILCGGVPSEKIFSRYMNEISDNRNIKSVTFRPKEYGWNYSGIKTTFCDGSEYMIHSVRDPYLRGFLNWLFVGKACADCQFAPPARQGDFSIGDFWNIDRYNKKIDYKDGVSCLLVNNDKGEMVWESINNKFCMKQEVPISFLKRFNRLQQLRKHHLARSRFFDLFDSDRPFETIVNDTLEWRFDVAVTGCWTVQNYGGELTYFALYNVLKDLGYTVIMVERRSDIPNYNIPNPSLFIKNPYPFYDISRIHKNLLDQEELNIRVNNFLVGSDQIWNYRFMSAEDIKSYNFDYVADYRKKISYGSSFGSVSFTGDDRQKEEFRKLIQRFHKVSVREPSAVKLLREEFEVSSQHVLDPVFLCDKSHFYNLVKHATCCVSGEYVFSYIIHPNDNIHGLNNVAKSLHCGLRNTINADREMLMGEGFTDESWPYSYESNCKLENWLFLLMNSKYVITDSFHAVCLSIIFHKQFVFISGDLTDDNGLERVTALLKMLHLDMRLVSKVRDLLGNNIFTQLIDYHTIDSILEKEVEISRLWLKNALDVGLVNERV